MKNIRRTGSSLVAAALISCMAVTSVMAAPVDDLEQQRSEAQSEANDLQAQLTELLSQINAMEEQVIDTGEKIIQAQEDLEAAEEKAQEQYDSMKIRIKYMYEDGSTDFWTALLTAENFTDLLNKAEYVSNVHSYDRAQLEALIETQKEIEELKATLEEEQATLEEQQAEYTAEQERVNAELAAKKAEVADFDEQLQAALAAVAQETEESQSSAGTGSEADTSGDASDVQGGQEGQGGSSNDQNGGDSEPSGGGGSDSGSDSSSGDTSAAQAIVNAAYEQLGVPYVTGGTSPGVGFDCSGLVQYCHSVAGISIPRTSGSQGSGGKAVSSPQPGDVVCGPGHVGIYIGNGQMIHAPHTGDVVKISRVSDVFDSPWYRRYW